MTPLLINKIILDSNAYFRLADNLYPLLANEFGESAKYKLYILSGTDYELKNQPRLLHKFEWLLNEKHINNRKSGTIKIRQEIKEKVKNTSDFLLDATRGLELGCSRFDIRCAAVCKVLDIPLVTDDSDLRALLEEFEISAYSTMELLHIMYKENRITCKEVEDTITLWEYFNDFPAGFHSDYKKLFGN